MSFFEWIMGHSTLGLLINEDEDLEVIQTYNNNKALVYVTSVLIRGVYNIFESLFSGALISLLYTLGFIAKGNEAKVDYLHEFETYIGYDFNDTFLYFLIGLVVFGSVCFILMTLWYNILNIISIFYYRFRDNTNYL